MLIMYVYIYKNYILLCVSHTEFLSIPTQIPLPNTYPVFKDAQSRKLSRALDDNSQSLDGFETVWSKG